MCLKKVKTISQLTIKHKILFFVIIFLSINDCSQIELHITDKVDSLFNNYNNSNSPGAAIGIYKDGEVYYINGYGMADLEHNVPINEKTVFFVASISKQFTAMSVLLLQEQGKLSIDDDIRKYLPEFPDYGNTITIRHLLNHTSGIKDHLELQTLKGLDILNYYPEESVYQLLTNLTSFNFKPGERYQYSNGGYFILAQIVKKVSNKTLKDFATENIFKPLGMKNTTFIDQNGDLIKNRAMGYSSDNNSWKNKIMRFDNVGAVGLYTTIEDFFKWDQNLKSDKLMGKINGLIKKMTDKGKLDNGVEIPYGLGLRLGQYKGLYTIGHGGSFGGYQAYYKRFPEQDCGIAVFGNFSQLNPHRYVNSIADILFEKQLIKEDKILFRYSKEDAAKAPEDLLYAYTGYFAKEGKVINFHIDQDTLFCKQLWNNNSYPIYYKGKNEFFVDNSNMIYEFLKTEEKVVFHRNGKSAWNKLNPEDFDENESYKYLGEYFCNELDVSYIIKRKKDEINLIIPNCKERLLDFFGKDHAQLESYLIIFQRDKKNQIIGFSFFADSVGDFSFKKKG